MHSIIIAHLRQHLPAALQESIADWNDDKLLRQLFTNYHHVQPGVRLTAMGQKFMETCFCCYEFECKAQTLTPTEIIFLNKHTKMPYYFGQAKLVVYEKSFAVSLRLVGGSLATLVETGI